MNECTGNQFFHFASVFCEERGEKLHDIKIIYDQLKDNLVLPVNLV